MKTGKLHELFSCTLLIKHQLPAESLTLVSAQPDIRRIILVSAALESLTLVMLPKQGLFVSYPDLTSTNMPITQSIRVGHNSILTELA